MSSTQQPTDSTDNNQPTPTAQKSGMTRRDLLRRSAVGGATLAGVSTGAIRLDHGPIGEAEAIAPAVAAGIAGGAALGWTVREAEILGSDAPPEGLTENALLSEVMDTARARESNDSGTFTDNENLIDSLSHAAYADAKIDAIDALNEQKTQEEVSDASAEALDEYETTLLKNVFRSWNESAQEFETILNRLEEHPDVEPLNAIFPYATSFSTHDTGPDYGFDTDTEEYELPDGSTIEITTVETELEITWQDTSSSGTRSISPIGDSDSTNISTSNDTGENDADLQPAVWYNTDLDDIPEDIYDDLRGSHMQENGRVYLDGREWVSIFDGIRETFDDVRDGMSLWVSEVYSDVQSGELDTAELLTPREQAELTAEDEDFPQAIADLQALNVAVDLEREAEIWLPHIEATVWGQLGYTGDENLETGTVQPDDKDGSIYLTYDVSQGQGEWSAYEEGIDGGQLTFTAEPFVETIYYVDTVAGETVELTEGDFEEDDDGEEWIADLSHDLDDAITDVEQIEFYAETEETQYETIRLQDEFEIITFSDSDGEEYDSADFESSEPQTDDNYITQEEWEDQQERHEELIQKYEDAQGGVSIPSFEDVLDGEANGLIGIAVVGLVFVFGILSALNPLS